MDNNNDKNKDQTDQPTENPTTLTCTRVLQDILADTGDYLETTSDNASDTENTETEWQSQTKDQTTLHDLDMEKVTKTRWPRTEIRKMGEKENGKSILFV